MLPGVASKGSFDASMYIRGGSAYEMVGVIDNIPIYQPYFWGGRVSLFNSKIAQKVDFFPGGYSAKYGHSLSGIIDVYTKDGDFKKAYKELDISITEMNYYQTAPIQKDKSAYMISYRRTYYDIFAPLFISDDSGPVNMPYLQSFQGKVTHKFNESQKLRTGFYIFNDGADMPLNLGENDNHEGKFIYDGNKIIVSSQLDSTLSKKLFNQLTLAYYTDDGFYKTTDEHAIDAKWNEDTWMLRNDLTWELSAAHQIEGGGIYYGIARDNTSSWVQPPDPEEANSVTVNASAQANFPVVFSSLYLQDRWKMTEQSTLLMGLRWDGVKVSDFSWNSYVQPRISYQYQLAPKTTLKSYYGVYRQYPSDAINSKLSGTNTLIREPANLKMELAAHYGTGVEHFIGDDIRFKLEAFYKDYDQLSIDTGTYPEETYKNKGVGKAGGIELMLHKISGDDYDGWITYTFSKTRRKDVDGWFIPDFDVTHMINMYGDFKVGTANHLVTTIKYSTGLPYTPILDTKTNSNTGALEYTLGNRYSKRLSDYFRVDVWYEWPGATVMLPIPFLPLSKKKIWGVFPAWDFKGSTRFGIYNLLNTRNQTSYYWSESKNKAEFVYDFPLMMIFGYNIKF